jgi:NAD(P)-dependent dehydrogenase (short-subunit alcohol dehydrogenase family)
MSNYIVFAASSSIGTELSRILTKENKLFITARKPEILEQLKHELAAEGELLDITDFEATEKVFLDAKNSMGEIDGVACCAGSLLLKSAHLTTRQQYNDVIEASLTTAFSVVRAAGKHMSYKGGSVVLVSSAAANEGLANHDAIAAAKAGINGLVLSAAASYAGSNIRFNAVAPGLTETKLTASITASEAGKKISESMHALGRLGKPADVARLMAFLLKPENDWITGQIIGVDGGLGSVRPKTKV